MNRAEFDKIESEKCPVSDNCDYSCTTCPIDSSIVEKWRSIRYNNKQ